MAPDLSQMSHPILLSILLFMSLETNYAHMSGSEEHQQFSHTNPNCEPIKIEMCSDIPYNYTIYPNLLKHSKQEEAEVDIKQYEMLVKVQCSPDFKFFLCTLFTPVCTILNEPLPPCRHLCLSAKNGCDSLMGKFGYSWPEIFDCDKMPKSKDGMCVGENENEHEEEKKMADTTEMGQHKKQQFLECPHTMKVLSTTRYFLQIANQTLEQCSLPCQNDGLTPTFFTAQIRHYIRLWTSALAVTCTICCLFTIITFLVDLDRFEYPERAILFMAFCYMMVGLTYMTGLGAEDGLSCAVHSATKQPLVTQGNENIWCSGLALMHFYFTSSGTIWWLILCFSWFMVTTLKWGEAPVGQVFSTYFNAFAWLLPILGIIFLFVYGGIDGDVFTGICSVGNLQPRLFLHFVIIPQAIAIGIGLVLFICGFFSILRIRSYIKRNRLISNKFENAEASEKLSRLMIHISSFSLLYLIPMIIGLYCAYYQAINMNQWLTNWYSTRCLHAQRAIFGFTQPREQCPIRDDVINEDNQQIYDNQPAFLPFFLKYFSNFTCGLASAIWTLNGKTVGIYGDFFARFIHRADPHGRPARVPTRIN